jgi:hypothetical protein
MKRKILNLQDSNEIWFKFLFWILFWTEAGHVAQYDWSVPVRSDHGLGPLDLKWSIRSRSVGTGSLKWTNLGVWFSIQRPRFKERGSHLGLGFLRAISIEAYRRRAPMVLWWSLTLEKTWTAFNLTRGSRSFDRRCWLLPEESGRGNWSSVWRRGASGDEATLDLGQNRVEQKDQKERQSKRKSLGEEGVRGSAKPHRNRQRRAAASVGFHREICRLEAVFAREKKRGWGRRV